MAEPDSADMAITTLQRGLKETLVKVCETEQRSKLLSILLKLKLLPRDVKNFTEKQLLQQRNLVSRGWVGLVFKSGKTRLTKKLADSKLDERKLRRKRDLERSKLEDMVSKNVYMRMMNKMKSKVDRIRLQIKKKHANKVKEYLLERDEEELRELSILQEEMGEFGKLRIFSGKSIPQEERKPQSRARRFPFPSMSWRFYQRTPTLL